MRGVKTLWGVAAVLFAIQAVAPCMLFAGSDGYFTSAELRAMSSAGYTQQSSSNINNGAVSFTNAPVTVPTQSSTSSAPAASSTPAAPPEVYYATDPLPVSQINYSDPEQNVYVNLDDSYNPNRDYVQETIPGTSQFDAAQSPLAATAPAPAAAPVVVDPPAPFVSSLPAVVAPAAAAAPAVSGTVEKPVYYYDPGQDIYIVDYGTGSGVLNKDGKLLTQATGVTILDKQYWAGLQQVTGAPQVTAPLVSGLPGVNLDLTGTKQVAAVPVVTTVPAAEQPKAAAPATDPVYYYDPGQNIYIKNMGTGSEIYDANGKKLSAASGVTIQDTQYFSTLKQVSGIPAAGVNTAAVMQTTSITTTTVVPAASGPQDTRVKADGVISTPIKDASGKEIGQRLVYRDGSLAIWINNQQVYYNKEVGSAYDFYTARDLLKGELGRQNISGVVPDYQKAALYCAPLSDLELDSSIGDQQNFGSLIFTNPGQSQLYTSDTTGRSFTLRGEFNADGKLSGYIWSWTNASGQVCTKNSSGVSTIDGVNTAKPAATSTDATTVTTPAVATPLEVLRLRESAVKKMASQHDILWTVGSSGTEYTIFSDDNKVKHILTFQYDKATDKAVSGNSADYKWAIPIGKTAYEWEFEGNQPL